MKSFTTCHVAMNSSYSKLATMILFVLCTLITSHVLPGCYFIVDVDIKEHGGTKIDKVANSILTILRHCGRIKEVRGGQLTRYVYIDRY